MRSHRVAVYHDALRTARRWQRAAQAGRQLTITRPEHPASSYFSSADKCKIQFGIQLLGSPIRSSGQVIMFYSSDLLGLFIFSRSNLGGRKMPPRWGFPKWWDFELV